jgi:RNA polymerase sigma-70 factor (ECF subfamily)
MPIALKENKDKLLAKVAGGDRDAFTQLYTDHLNNLFRYIFLITRSKEETEEILQEVFIRIWENRSKLVAIDSFENYVFRCAKNKLLDNIRRQQVKQRAFSEIKRSKEVSASTTSDQSAYKEYYLLVQQAIEKLPPKRKLIFRLNIENGYSREEIARHLNISDSVVKKQIYKASYFVRAYLVKHGEISMSLLTTLGISCF